MRPRLRCAGCAMRSVLHATLEKPADHTRDLRGGRRRLDFARTLQQPQPVLQLRDAELELFHLVAGDEAELPGEPGEAVSRPLAEPGGVAAPARDRLLEH